MKQKADVFVGLQWGDEGKGKYIDLLATIYDIIARFQGGPNAGHSLEFNGNKFVLHQIPSGIFWKHIMNIIGNGVVFDPVKFKKEVLKLVESGQITLEEIKERLIISNEAHFITPGHIWQDEANEIRKGKDKIGSTLCGIGPTYEDKDARVGIRIGDIKKHDFKEIFVNHFYLKKSVIENIIPKFFETHKNWEEKNQEFLESIEFLKEFSIQDTPLYINTALKNGKKVLAEGAQGTELDINFGSYPFVTSSTTISAGACIGLGIPPNAIGEIYGLMKAYCTRVGSGPFLTELFDETGEKIRAIGIEFGATTGRPRRCGWLDLVQLKRAVMLNGVTKLVMSKADVLDGFEHIYVCTEYDSNNKPVYQSFKGWKDLNSIEFSCYIQLIENFLDMPISMISTGPDREQIIYR